MSLLEVFKNYSNIPNDGIVKANKNNQEKFQLKSVGHRSLLRVELG